jgi:hypothetical protein
MCHDSRFDNNHLSTLKVGIAAVDLYLLSCICNQSRPPQENYRVCTRFVESTYVCATIRLVNVLTLTSHLLVVRGLLLRPVGCVL